PWARRLSGGHNLDRTWRSAPARSRISSSAWRAARRTPGRTAPARRSGNRNGYTSWAPRCVEGDDASRSAARAATAATPGVLHASGPRVGHVPTDGPPVWLGASIPSGGHRRPQRLWRVYGKEFRQAVTNFRKDNAITPRRQVSR